MFMIYIVQQLSLWMDKDINMHTWNMVIQTTDLIHLFKFKHQSYKLSYIKDVILPNTRVYSLEPKLQKVNPS